MFRIKLCGVTNPDDARLAADAGADAIGLNFYAGSPRSVDRVRAQPIVSAVKSRILLVGVFVNAPGPEILELCSGLSLDAAQLHGDEPPELLKELAGLPIVRAFRLGPLGLSPVTDYLDRCRQLGCTPQRVLLDAGIPGQYGGTGATADWNAAAHYNRLEHAPPLVLAGGLNPGNVAAAIRTVGPAAVDVASGIESSPGRKAPDLVRKFVEEARAEFQNTDARNKCT